MTIHYPRSASGPLSTIPDPPFTHLPSAVSVNVALLLIGHYIPQHFRARLYP
jgi:hypothetical protein